MTIGIAYLILSFWGKAYRSRILLLLLSIGFSFILLEVLCMLYAHFTKMPDYTAYLTGNEKNIYHIWPANEMHELKSGEFSYTRKTNSIGYADKEWALPKKAGGLRILALGDSFTEGDGAPQDSAYPFLLEKNLLAKHADVEVLNAGTCGSDPFFNYKNLCDRLLQYKPDIVIQTLSSNDITEDIAIRGGMERFKENNTIAYRASPRQILMYQCSYIIRALADVWEGIYEHTGAFENETNSTLRELIGKYGELAKANNFKVIWVLIPRGYEAKRDNYLYNFDYLANVISHTPGQSCMDMLSLYKLQVQQGQPLTHYYWPNDGHHNGKGYELMAATIAKGIEADKDIFN
ncbi:MAG TPA: GDSL-type esterase/lipase family protein [Chitinophagales bacterium]|nr:GDSL-type esterase/lipase family protein [Chitinophagales bacterium]